MQGLLAQATSVEKEIFEFDFSICTLVNDKQEYKEMIVSFVEAGFSLPTCEYLYIDNSVENKFDAYSGLNILLQRAKGKYIILCHQDILLDFDKRKELEQRIHELQVLDPKWAVGGNAGAAGPNHIVYKVTYSDGITMSKGKFPLKVHSLDENFILLKNAAGLSLSADLSGFHLYGVDICLQATARGYPCYVIDFNILHKSRGNPDESFQVCKKNLIQKYNFLFRNRWIQTTTTCFYLSGSMLGKFNENAVSLFCIRMWNGLKKRIK
ncbi:MAG: hypothetical protein WD426_07950 [Anditalea sp.]